MRTVAARPCKPLLAAAWPALPEQWLDSTRLSSAQFAREAPWGAAPFASERIAAWLRDYFESRASWTRCLEVTVEQPAANSREKPITLTCWDNQVARFTLCFLSEERSLRASCLFRLDDPVAALQQLRRWVEQPERHLPDALAMLQVWAQDTALIRSWTEVHRALSSHQPVSLAELAWHRAALPSVEALAQHLPAIIATSSWQALATYGSPVIAALPPSPQAGGMLILACEQRLPAEPSPEVALTFLKLTAPLHGQRPPAHGFLLAACTALRGLPLPHAARPDLRALLCSKGAEALECTPFLRAALDTLLNQDQMHAIAPLLGSLSRQGREQALDHLAASIAAALPPSTTSVWIGSPHAARPLRLLYAWSELMGGEKPVQWQRLMTLPPLDPGLQPLLPPAFWKAAREHLTGTAGTHAVRRELFHWAWQQLGLSSTEQEYSNPEPARRLPVFPPNDQLHAAMQRLLKASEDSPEELQRPLEDIAHAIASQQMAVPGDQTPQGCALLQMMRQRFREPKPWLVASEVEARLSVVRALTAHEAFWTHAYAPTWLVGTLAHLPAQWCAEAVLLDFELHREPWSAPEAPCYAHATFDTPQWLQLCHHLGQLSTDAEVSAALQWLSSLSQLSSPQQAAIAAAGEWMNHGGPHRSHLACAALRLCVNPGLARSMLPEGTFTTILLDCLQQKAHSRWRAVEAQATRALLPALPEPLAPLLHAKLALELAERWARQPPDLEQAQLLWAWCEAVAAHPAMQEVWITAAVAADASTLKRWRNCWAVSKPKDSMDRLLTARVWASQLPNSPHDHTLLQELWIEFPNERPLPALDWWTQRCAELLVAADSGKLSRLLENTDASLHHQLLTRLRKEHAENSSAFQTGLECFAEHCLNSKAKIQRWTALNEGLAARHARGPIMEDVLLDIL